jgi:hypothetical protein
MFRLRYASGEEAIFRSVEELALGLRSGIIGTDTVVLDNTAHVWQPLAQHPLYPEATALAATLSYGDLELEPVVGASRAVSSGEFRSPIAPPRSVYQMVSISGGELQARRNQKRLLKGGIVAGAALVVALSAFMIWKERNRTSHTSQLEVLPRPAAPVARRAPAAPNTANAYWLSPGILASRREDSQARIDAVLTDSATRMGLQDLTQISRLNSPDGLREGIDLLRRWRGLSNDYQETSFRMLRAYQDSANAQVRADQWSLLDVNDWRSRPAFVEGPLDMVRHDSLAGGLQRLYEILLDLNGNYSIEPGRAEFSTLRARVEYQRVMGLIERYGPSPANQRERVSLHLSLLRHALEGPRLPPLPPESL